MVHDLLGKIMSDGVYLYAIDYVKRCPTCPIGATYSKHKEGLAIDIHLYLPDGNYMGDERGEEKAHEVYGAYWESLGGSWGGRFNDSNHYSLGE